MKQFNFLLGNELDDDADACLNEGITNLNSYILNNCKTIEQFQAMFNDDNETSSQLSSLLPILTNTITSKKKKFGGAEKKLGVSGIVLDSTK